ncbi:MAG: hypothetical protein BWZ11_01822 [Bacteroidetes bacterium ADurb.BinA395]|nr:MAG: hypothetical protein BWZ11_01822 [Bacteroidetes bacterium ADurb.BinA395]
MVGNNAIKTNTQPAKNFPNTNSFILKGLVMSISHVPDFFSSAKDRMVMAGHKNKKSHGAK